MVSRVSVIGVETTGSAVSVGGIIMGATRVAYLVVVVVATEMWSRLGNCGGDVVITVEGLWWSRLGRST